MRQYAWYSPEIDVIILQTIVQECFISFEWDWGDMVKGAEYFDLDPEHDEIMDFFLWFPLGEI